MNDATSRSRAALARASNASPPASGWNLLLVVAFITGVALRAWQIDIQILLEDEWHAIHKLLSAAPLDILTHLGAADYSIPLTLYYQWLERHAGLTEWGMHAPSLVAAIALLLVGPRLIASWSPLPVRAIWLALLAVSPLLVYHAKLARPYALTSTLTFVAIVAFRAWWRVRRRRDAVAYVVATFAAGWLHVVSLTFALLPFVYYGVRTLASLRSGGERGDALASLRRLVGLGIATALPLAAVLLPPLVIDWEAFTLKAAQDHVTVESLWRTLLMLAGTGHPAIGIAVWASAAYGFVRLRARDADLAVYVATIVVVGIAVVAASGVTWISRPLVLARYAIPALPFALLFAAEGVFAALVAVASLPLRPLAAAGFVAALLFTGPIPREWQYPNQFWAHMLYQYDYDPAHNPYVELVGDIPIPKFYEQLRSEPPGSLTLVELPYRLESQFNPLARYQQVHRQRVLMALFTPTCGVSNWGEYPESVRGMQLREMVHLSALLRGDVGDADYLVVHHYPPQEPWPDLRTCLPMITAAFGAPIYDDADLSVYSLAHVSLLGNNRRPVQQ